MNILVNLVKIRRLCSPLWAALVFGLISQTLSAQIVDNVDVVPTTEGYDLEIHFITPLRYQNYAPTQPTKTLDIFLKIENIADQTFYNSLNESVELSWDNSIPTALVELTYDGELADNPRITARFKRALTFNVRASKDLRAVIISVIDPQLAQTQANQQQSSSGTSIDLLIAKLQEEDVALAKILQQANQSMLDKDYSKAVRLLSKVRDESSGEVQQRAQELIGVSREFNGQLAQAKAEYTQYLQDYPNSEGALRVKQRLAAIITAAQQPKQRLRAAKNSKQINNDEWQTQFYGSVAQTYYRDETTPEDQSSQLIRSDLNSDLDFVAKVNKGNVELGTQFVGSYRNDLMTDGKGSEFIPSIAYVDGKLGEQGLYARVGRQSFNSAGILGRFDGARLAYEVNDNYQINAVLGYPVNYSDKSAINSNVNFQGLSVDISSIWTGWDFNAFYISQQNHQVKDREAMGGEIRFRDNKKSLFTLIDYDILFNDLNIFLFIGNWNFSESNNINVVVDYRNSPILTTNNAIQGQGVSSLDQLLEQYSEDELQQLARDRTAKSQSVTSSLTHQFNQDWQMVGEVTYSKYGETLSSAGIEGYPASDNEFMYSVQLVGNKVAFDTDTMILSWRYSDSTRSTTHTLNTNWRFNIKNQFRINPRLRLDYRKSKLNSDDRWMLRPLIRLDYRYERWLKFEMDLGYEWLNETFSEIDRTTTGYFVSIGYRAQF
ncbi:tol-pal system YbgF family protein [Paraglaciecola sp. MB-3u-78]|uniref:tetratricopeptide repeat protein n=1 Tax=Paraglaciecola sp. MB-3u-78 TaxID=2058332 RepID=UPI000C347C9F|nr:hypothetical protein [Paraglaciecola sp. MB-3u-78]PKG99126.1 hypothetical protein CXF95_07460 [Paraglaciecola sp. MB-3u-78]